MILEVAVNDKVAGAADRMAKWGHISNSGDQILIVSRGLLTCNTKQRENESLCWKMKYGSIFSGRIEKGKQDS